MRYINALILVCIGFSWQACSPSDEQRLLGKWQCEQDWFLFYDNGTYDGGKAIITMLNKARYTMNSEQKELTLYTDQERSTFYLNYAFKGNDTLLLNNKMNSAERQVVYIRQAETAQPR